MRELPGDRELPSLCSAERRSRRHLGRDHARRTSHAASAAPAICCHGSVSDEIYQRPEQRFYNARLFRPLARQVGALAPDAEVNPRLIVELLHPIVATAAGDSFTYSRPWLRRLMTHLTEPRFAPALRNLTPPPEYALVWRATLSAAGLFAQLGATVPTRGFHLTYSPGFRGGICPGPAAAKATPALRVPL